MLGCYPGYAQVCNSFKSRGKSQFAVSPKPVTQAVAVDVTAITFIACPVSGKA